MSSNDIGWEPLPKRNRKRGAGESGKSSVRAAPPTQARIDDAVQARIDSHRAKGSLTSRDGMDGDNYECMFYSICLPKLTLY